MIWSIINFVVNRGVMEKPDVCKFERGLKEALPYLPNNQFQTRNPVKLMTFFLFFLFFFFNIFNTNTHTLHFITFGVLFWSFSWPAGNAFFVSMVIKCDFIAIWISQLHFKAASSRRTMLICLLLEENLRSHYTEIFWLIFAVIPNVLLSLIIFE